MKSCKAFDRRSSSVTHRQEVVDGSDQRQTPAGRQSSFGSHAPLPGDGYILYVKGHWDLPVGGQFSSLLADS